MGPNGDVGNERKRARTANSIHIKLLKKETVFKTIQRAGKRNIQNIYKDLFNGAERTESAWVVCQWTESTYHQTAANISAKPRLP